MTSFDHGTEVTLSAAPADASTIAWSGCDQVVGDECRVSMDSNKMVSARLEPAPSPPATPTPPPTPTPAPDPAPTPAPAPPNTKLFKAKIAGSTAKFAFAADEPGAWFRCALAKRGKKLVYRHCSSPVTYRKLVPARYVFKVKAVGPQGADPAPATRRFKVLARHRHRSAHHRPED